MSKPLTELLTASHEAYHQKDSNFKTAPEINMSMFGAFSSTMIKSATQTYLSFSSLAFIATIIVLNDISAAPKAGLTTIPW